MNDEITSDPNLYPGSQQIEKALVKAQEAPTPEASQQELVKIQDEVERFATMARNPWQKSLINQYYTAKALNVVLAEAALVKLLQSNDDEIVLKAAKELRGRGGSRSSGDTNLTAEQMVVQLPEDPSVAALKENI